jgi:N-acetyl-1-D-myo-inositol-2-amino-2-deoxy-alpha-D-glucopyranoside deacetylase
LVLLAVHAHPDDESLGTGGTLARYASEGVETVLVCATKGEEGEVLNPSLDPAEIPEDFSQLRMRELESACGILGIRKVHFLGYRDSGMEGSASNENPEALANADLREATERLVRVIREARPHVVITYNERGLYGHPDHIAVNRITLSAMEATGDPSRFEQLPWPPWRPRKLYYTAIPRSRLLGFKRALEDRGEEADFNVDFLGTPDEKITTRLDVGPFVDQKLRAIYSHKSQIGPRSFVSRLEEPMRREALSTECYVCIQGCPDDAAEEDDLFQGMRE